MGLRQEGAEERMNIEEFDEAMLLWHECVDKFFIDGLCSMYIHAGFRFLVIYRNGEKFVL